MRSLFNYATIYGEIKMCVSS